MIRRAQRAGIEADYLLADAWFGAKPMIRMAGEQLLTPILRMKKNTMKYRLTERQAGKAVSLTGWSQARRVIVLHHPIKGEIVLAGEDNGQQLLGFIKADRRTGKEITGYEHAVLVTNTDFEILSLGQLYRDRADAENVFDELKNQWGWGGFTTHDLHRCQLAARGVALIYTQRVREPLRGNWWSLYVRLANPQARREAITSRPWLMSSVGRRTEHAGQTTITLTGLHADFAKARAALMRVSVLLQEWVVPATEQLNPTTVWLLVCDYLIAPAR